MWYLVVLSDGAICFVTKIMFRHLSASLMHGFRDWWDWDWIIFLGKFVRIPIGTYGWMAWQDGWVLRHSSVSYVITVKPLAYEDLKLFWCSFIRFSIGVAQHCITPQSVVRHTNLRLSHPNCLRSIILMSIRKKIRKLFFFKLYIWHQEIFPINISCDERRRAFKMMSVDVRTVEMEKVGREKRTFLEQQFRFVWEIWQDRGKIRGRHNKIRLITLLVDDPAKETKEEHGPYCRGC